MIPDSGARNDPAPIADGSDGDDGPGDKPEAGWLDFAICACMGSGRLRPRFSLSQASTKRLGEHLDGEEDDEATMP